MRSLCAREMAVGMHEHAAASAGVNGSIVECSLGEWHAGVRELNGDGNCDCGGTKAG